MALSAISFHSAIAAVAIAAAAVLTSTAVASADEIEAPGAGWAGNSVLNYLTDGQAENNDGVGGDHALDPIFNDDGDLTPNFFENDFWWFGPSNLTPPPPIADFTIDIFSALPPFVQPLWGWFLNGDIDWEACVLGASVKFGPYGSTTFGVANHC